MLNWLLTKMADPLMDDAMEKMLTTKYAENPFVLLPAMEKLTPTAIIEAGLRAETGKELERPLGSPLNLDPWIRSCLIRSNSFSFQLKTSTVLTRKQ